MKTKRPYPQLFQMFGGYLHQDWDYEFIWEEDEKPHFKAAVEAYKEDCKTEVIHTSIQELEELINKHHTNSELENIVSRKLGCAVDPEYFGLTYQQFLIEVLQILKE